MKAKCARCKKELPNVPDYLANATWLCKEHSDSKGSTKSSQESKSIKTSICVECGNFFEFSKHNKYRKFCDEKCRVVYNNKKAIAKRRTPAAVAIVKLLGG
jgi:endogenous inhibitor of DNA gyrase (YacG/DUF329 family)